MQHDPDDPWEWMTKAEQDASAALLLLTQEQEHAAAAAFHVQQAIEKMLKAVHIARQLPVPMTHDLRLLFDALEPVPELKAARPLIVSCSIWAVALRYPGAPDPTASEVHAGLRALGVLREWASLQLPSQKPRVPERD